MLCRKWKEFWIWYLAPAPIAYCPIIELLDNEPEKWQEYNTWSSYTGSIKHMSLGVSISYDRDDFCIKLVIREGNELPVHKRDLRKALFRRERYFEKLKTEKSFAALNRLTQDMHSERVARIIEYRKQLAKDEQLEIEVKLRELPNPFL